MGTDHGMRGMDCQDAEKSKQAWEYEGRRD